MIYYTYVNRNFLTILHIYQFHPIRAIIVLHH